MKHGRPRFYVCTCRLTRQPNDDPWVHATLAYDREEAKAQIAERALDSMDVGHAGPPLTDDDWDAVVHFCLERKLDAEAARTYTSRRRDLDRALKRNGVAC